MSVPKRRVSDTSLLNRPVAVIEIGSSSVRLMIAQIDESGREKIIDFLSQTLVLGNDTFTKGTISSQAMEECVRALRHFRSALDEYGIVEVQHVRIVATTAVREAFNRDAFVDRVFIATGFSVEVLDEVDIARLMYLSWRSNFCTAKDYERTTLLAEVGGGNTDLLHMTEGRVDSAQTYRLGSLRLRKSIESVNATVSRQRELIEAQVVQVVNQVRRSAHGRASCRIIALGGDMRFAAEHILGAVDTEGLVRVSLAKLRSLADDVLSLSVNETALRYHITFSDAETLGPSLLFYVRLAEAYACTAVYAGDISIRHGMLIELARRTTWTDDFREQVISPALEVGRRYHFDEAHCSYVARQASVIFAALASEHKLDVRWELVLHVAALLHDVGTFISTRSHHKHSMYVIRNTELFGFNKQDILLTALVARYHRRNTPKPIHEGYADLSREDRIVVCKLAAVLRVADALDSARKQRFKKISCSMEDGSFIITVPASGDVTLERLNLAAKGAFFTEIYGMPVVLRPRGLTLE